MKKKLCLFSVGVIFSLGYLSIASASAYQAQQQAENSANINVIEQEKFEKIPLDRTGGI